MAVKLHNAKHPVVQEITAAAKVLGCEILKVNLRCNWFHIRNGKEIRVGFFYKGISARNLHEAVLMSRVNGRRIDSAPGSLYAPYIASIKDDTFPSYAEICKRAADIVISNAKEV